VGKRLAILQSNYLPCKGYFDLINSVDVFILYDTAQFTKNDWRNRNRIKRRQGTMWITIPVSHRFGQSIADTVVSDRNWATKHWLTVSQAYARAAHFESYRDRIFHVYREVANERKLSVINHRFLSEICKLLDITTPILWSTDYRLVKGWTERLVGLCKQVGATEYLSDPAARARVDEGLFEREGISVSYADYSGYPEYGQLTPPFEHEVSILDLLFNAGPNSCFYMKSFGACAAQTTGAHEGRSWL
jgi:hypothetical protein